MKKILICMGIISQFLGLFGCNQQSKNGNVQNETKKTESHFDKYRNELEQLGLKSIEDLEKLVEPLVRTATKIEVNPASEQTEKSQMRSHFGGNPYFEKGEKWPSSKNGKELDFIFQIFNNDEIDMPDHIKLVQFYYDWDEFPWDTKDDGWLVKIYDSINSENLEIIERPNNLEQSKYCEVTFKKVKSLPDWEGISLHDNNASKLSCVLNEEEPWASYDKVVSKFIGEQDYQSQLGGYPNWVQGESTPINSKGQPMRLLFQIDSEENAGLMWGDVGLVYVFYDQTDNKIEFSLQCH